MFISRTEKSKDDNAIGHIDHGQINFFSYEAYFKTVEALALSFKSMGIEINTKVAILGQTSKEWHFSDMALLCIGSVVVPLYPSFTENEIEYIYNHAECSYLIVDSELQLKKISLLKEKLHSLKAIIVLTDINEDIKKTFKDTVEIYSFKMIQRMGLEIAKKEVGAFKRIAESDFQNETASIIYTSGTTGQPKGAVIKHFALTAMLENIKKSMSGTFSNKDRNLCFLPLSHVLGRADSMFPLVFGGEIVYARSIETVFEDISIVRPTVMVAVPRIFEKIHKKIITQLDEAGTVKKKLFAWAQKASNNYFKKLDQDLSPTPSEIFYYQLAYKLVFKKIYDLFGGKFRYFISGGAPLSPDIAKFLRNAHLTILEGYGLTETIAPFTLNPAYKQIPGTVGIPLGNGEIKFAPDGEILLRSIALFSGYYRDEKSTQECFDDQGWFHTGDIGEFTKDGFLKITDRKKDIIITSGGKNVAPQKIENMLKTRPLISNAMVVGDGKNYLTAIISIEKATFLDQLAKLNLPKDCTTSDLAKHPEVKKMLDREVEEVNKSLASFETIKAFIVAHEEFSMEGGHLTPSLKLRKKVILDLYKNEIDAMYGNA